MIKVRILDRCEIYEGEAYVLVSEEIDSRGKTYGPYRPCEMCLARTYAN